GDVLAGPAGRDVLAHVPGLPERRGCRRGVHGHLLRRPSDSRGAGYRHCHPGVRVRQGVDRGGLSSPGQDDPALPPGGGGGGGARQSGRGTDWDHRGGRRGPGAEPVPAHSAPGAAEPGPCRVMRPGDRGWVWGVLMPISDPLVMPLARELLDCYAIELTKVETPPKYVGLRPGTVVDHLLSTFEDECCEGLA